VDTELFKPQPANAALAKDLGLEGKKVILYAGTHGYAHAVEVAIRAAKLLEDTDIQFLFIGDGSEKPGLVQMAHELGLKNTLFLDPVPVEQIALFYSFATAGLSTLRNLPLFDGTRPAKIFAAMACGKPILYSGSGEGARLVEKARAGIVVAPEDPKALAAATSMLVNNPNLAIELGQNGRRYVLEHLTWSRIVENWLSQLQERNSAR
jgi:glycosyltransferase involved in cell wall biosynthesis